MVTRASLLRGYNRVKRVNMIKFIECFVALLLVCFSMIKTQMQAYRPMILLQQTVGYLN